MGNEISTLGGAVATAATGVAAGVTFGQVEAVNNACKESAKFTAKKACNTTVRHAGETVIKGAAAVGTTAAVVVTLGQVDSLNEAMVECVDQTIEAGAATADGVVNTVNDVVDNVPVVGHVKGAVHYVCGDKEGGDKAMKSASRTTGVVLGGAAGIVGGPAGMVAGGVAGGAAVDGLTTGVESAIKGEYTPSGTIEAWTRVAQAENPEELTAGIIDGVTMSVVDGYVGYEAGTNLNSRQNPIPDDYPRQRPIPDYYPRQRRLANTFTFVEGYEYPIADDLVPVHEAVRDGLRIGGLI